MAPFSQELEPPQNPGRFSVKQDHAQAVEWTLKAAQQNVADAQYNLGVMYAKGRGVKQDHVKAVEWTFKAAQQGNAHAQFNLGVMLAQGQGVKKNEIKAIEWFRKAAEQGHTSAQAVLVHLSGSASQNASRYRPR